MEDSGERGVGVGGSTQHLSPSNAVADALPVFYPDAMVGLDPGSEGAAGGAAHADSIA